ncbi:MAG: hypothetical protein KGD65_02610 [Candidatus Lokiarchaeota archaeon]|nr:hypothetical protein [Candidatus Lokiarchaeota archaeon]
MYFLLGKEKEALEITAKMNMYFSSEIEGYKAKSEVICDRGEAYKIIGMTAPEV